MRSVVAAMVSGLTLASPLSAAAQDRASLKLPLAVYASTAALDYHSTHHFLQFEGLQEWNPTIAWLDHRPKMMIAVGAAMEATAAYALHRWIGRKHPKVFRIGMYAVSGLHIVGALRNYDTGSHPRIAAAERARWDRYRRCGHAC